MNKIYYIKHKQVKENAEKESIVYPCVFENYADAEKAFVEISKNKGYEVRHNEDGVIINSHYTNRRGVFNVLTIEAFDLAKSYSDFLNLVQNYEKED